MQFLKVRGQGVRILVGEFGLAEVAHGGEDVQSPAALFDGNILKRFNALELRANLIRRNNFAFSDEWNPGFGGNAAQGDVATDPTGATGGDG